MDRWFPMSVDWHVIRVLLVVVVLLVLAWLIGPVVLLLAWLTQRWAAAESWQARDRWASVGGFAWFFGVIAVILFVGTAFPVPFLTPLLFAVWERLPTGWNETVLLTVIRWSNALPLAPLLAVTLELVHPRTIWSPRRALLDTERAQLQAQEEQRQATARAKAAQTAKREEQRANGQGSQGTQRQQRAGAAPQTTPQEQSARPAKPPDVPPERADLQQGALWAKADQETAAPEASIQEKPVPKQEPPPAPKKPYDWNKGEGSLKDL